MSQGLRSAGALAGGLSPRRASRGSLAFWLYFVAAAALFLLEVAGSDLPQRVRAHANDLVAPVLSVLERPIRGAQNGLERIAGVSDIYVENQDLRSENDRLRQWREAALQLARENERLRQMMKVPGREVPTAATGRVVGVGGGAFERSVIINVGAGDGVRRQWPVVDEAGVVGRVIQVGQWSSRVLLVSDLNSRIPVRVERTGALAIAEGQNSERIALTYIPQGSEVRVGDRILTSGHGGVFPPDLPVGRVVEVDDDRVFLDAAALIDRIDYVRVMAYEIPVPEMVDGPALPPEGDGR